MKIRPLLLTCVAGTVLANPNLIAREKVQTAKISVSGLGFFTDRATKISLSRLWGDRMPSELSTNQIEDGALFIASNLSQEGFQHPVIEVDAKLADGSKKHFRVDVTLENLPPAGLHAVEVRILVKKGMRSYIDHLEIDGLHAFPETRARDYFFSEAALAEGHAARAYSSTRLERSADALEGALRQLGYEEATVKVVHAKEDEKTGKVDAKVVVNEGPLSELDHIEMDVRNGPETRGLQVLKLRKGGPWSVFRGQDLVEEVRRMYFKFGYADVRVRVTIAALRVQGGVKPIVVTVHIRPGEQVGIGQVKFEGNFRAHPSVLRRRVDVSSGDPLDPAEIEKARYRISRLGVFHSVDLKYEPEHGPVRDPLFILDEDRPFDANLMIGWGSYEELRGGVELIQRDLFGQANQSRLNLVQSFKSSRGDYTYSVPEILGESVDGSVRLFGLDRKEIAFRRDEYGGTLTLKRKFAGIGADGSLGYTYESLRNAQDLLFTAPTDNREYIVASIDLNLVRDARDNPLRPRRGYRWFVQSEFASHQLGSQVNYQRVELGGAYHTAWGHGRWIHLSLTHGFVTTLGSNDQSLPVNRRFYPGGEDSIRGYTEGEAAPRAADGLFIGAKSYTLLNTEVEQALTKNWSVVVFTDILGETEKLSSYPMDQEKISVGLGVRYYTLIGPVRLEYGQNVKRRELDPHGTLQFSVGFPF